MALTNQTGVLLAASSTLIGTMDGEPVTLTPCDPSRGPYGCDWCGEVKARVRSVDSHLGGPTTGPLICALCLYRTDTTVTEAG